MKSPFSRLSNALESAPITKDEASAHGAVRWYEMTAFLLVIPSLIVFSPGFIFACLNFYLSRLIARRHKLISVIGVTAVNVSYLLIPIMYDNPSLRIADFPIIVVLSFPIIFFISGYLAIYFQFKEGTSGRL